MAAKGLILSRRDEIPRLRLNYAPMPAALGYLAVRVIPRFRPEGRKPYGGRLPPRLARDTAFAFSRHRESFHKRRECARIARRERSSCAINSPMTRHHFYIVLSFPETRGSIAQTTRQCENYQMYEDRNIPLTCTQIL